MQEIKSLSQFNKLKTSSLLIIDFYATWCGPLFAKVDVDKVKDVAQTCNITAMPTFQFFQADRKVDEVKGADVQQLTTKIGYYTAAALKESEAVQPGSSPNHKQAVSKSGATPKSLRSVIDITAAKLFNASNLSSVRNVASPPPAGYAVASTLGSSQVVIHLPFTENVTLSQLKITVAKDSSPNAPSRIQLGTNTPVRVTKSPEGVETNDLSMESLTKAENTQSFNVYSDEYVNGIAELKLKASKFTGIKSLTIRIDANLSGDATSVSKVGEIDLIGTMA